MDLTQVKENNNIKFGCYIYQDGLTYKDIVHIALECERLGHDSIWLKDNYIPWIQDYLSIASQVIMPTLEVLQRINIQSIKNKLAAMECNNFKNKMNAIGQCLNAGLYSLRLHP